jgi:hypothetical protein
MADDPKQPTMFPRENPGPYGVARWEASETPPADTPDATLARKGVCVTCSPDLGGFVLISTGGPRAMFVRMTPAEAGALVEALNRAITETKGAETPADRTHSAATRAEAVAEARRLGDPTRGDGWRRLLWRMADLIEGDSETKGAGK